MRYLAQTNLRLQDWMCTGTTVLNGKTVIALSLQPLSIHFKSMIQSVPLWMAVLNRSFFYLSLFRELLSTSTVIHSVTLCTAGKKMQLEIVWTTQDGILQT